MAGHYVDNKKFLEALKEHRALCEKAKEEGTEPPQISNYIGKTLMDIATHLSYKSNFINYSYRDEMILDGIENCLRYVHNFNPDRSSNPFAYFTQVIFYAFLRRIAREKKQTVIKGKLIRDIPFEGFELQEHDEDGQYMNSYIDFMQNNSNFDDFIERKKEKKKKAKKDSLEDFMDVTDE